MYSYLNQVECKTKVSIIVWFIQFITDKDSYTAIRLNNFFQIAVVMKVV